MERPRHQHLDNDELNALVPSHAEAGPEAHGLSSNAVRHAREHVESCADCATKMLKYRRLINGSVSGPMREAAPGADCPELIDADWREVAAGEWPELKAKQLVLHAALCDHCGPRLRIAMSAHWDVHARARVMPLPASRPWPVLRWLAPLAALFVLAIGVSTIRSSSKAPLSGPEYAAYAVKTHRQHTQGRVALEVHSESLQALNEWFKTKAPFTLALPASPETPGEERPYHLEGARIVQVEGKSAAFIAYQVPTAKLQTTAASLMVAPESVAVASGGYEVHFKKVTFHYSTIDGYKVVTWSVHGLTYALVSEEGNNSQRSCMVCHSAMRDRDLSHSPAPSYLGGNSARHIWQ